MPLDEDAVDRELYILTETAAGEPKFSAGFSAELLHDPQLPVLP